MKRHLEKIVALLIALPPLLYVAGIVAQFAININNWKAAGGDMNVSPGLPSLSVKAVIEAILTFPEGLLSAAVVLGGVGLLLLYGRRQGGEDDRNFKIARAGSYGTASFMGEKEAAACFDIRPASKTDQDILGMLPGRGNRVITLPEHTRLNSNLAVCGASGTGKSRSISRNLILQAVKRGESLVITDSKSELYESTSEYLRANGYVVKVFNLIQMEHSDAWNCLNEVGGNELMAQIFTDVVLSNLTGEAKDAFWFNAEMNLLKALVLYVSLEMPEADRNFGTVYQILVNDDLKKLTKRMTGIKGEHTNRWTGEVMPPSPAYAPFSIFMQASETVRTSVIIGLGSKLQVMQAQLVKDITSYDEINLELPGQRKCAYFCIVSDQDSTFNFLSSLFFAFLFIRLVRYADNYCDGGALHTKVKFVLDEFPNCCFIPDFQKKCSTVRSRGISLAVFFQNIGQMKNRYPNDQWQEILGSCDTTVFLGCTDLLTAKYISDRIGTASVEVEGTARELNTFQLTRYTPSYRETNSLGRRQLLTPDEVLRLRPDEELIFIRGQKVFRAVRFDYSLHPAYKQLVSCKAIHHEPDWMSSGRVSSYRDIPPGDSMEMQTDDSPKPEKKGDEDAQPPKPGGFIGKRIDIDQTI